MSVSKKRIIPSLIGIITALSLNPGVANADLILKKDGSRIYNYYLLNEDSTGVTVKNRGGKQLYIPRSELKDYIYTLKDIDEETANKLEGLKAMEDWGEEKLGVPKSDNYLVYDENFETYHLLYYCNKLELPKTYFDLQLESFETEKEALDKKKELEAEGYDVYYRTAEAVATDSSISKTMLDAELFRKLFVVFHENSHDITDLPIDIDEACANIAGFFGALEYTKEKYGERSDEYKKNSTIVELVYKDDEMIIRYYNELEQLLESDLSKEEKLKEKDKILEELAEGRSKFWGKTLEKMNNPELSSDITYSRFGPLAKKVYEKAGSTKEAVKVFKNLSDKIKWRKYMYDQDDTREYCKKYLEDYLANP